MAAHKELIAKYARQFTESQQRIIDLEVSVADLKAESENASGRNQQSNDADEIARLRSHVAERDAHIAELNALSKELMTPEAPLQGRTDTADAIQLADARELVSSLESMLDTRTREVREWRLEAASNEKEAAEAKGLRTKLWISEGLVAFLKKSIDSKDNSLIAANNRVTTLKARSEQDTDRVDSLTADLDSLQAEKTFLVTRVGDLARELKALRKETDDDKNRLVLAEFQRDMQVAELENKLENERKRTREVEDMLTVEGKRCKKCHPVVLDLMDSDEDDELSAPGVGTKKVEGPHATDALGGLGHGDVGVITRGAARRAVFR